MPSLLACPKEGNFAGNLSDIARIRALSAQQNVQIMVIWVVYAGHFISNSERNWKLVHRKRPDRVPIRYGHQYWVSVQVPCSRCILQWRVGHRYQRQLSRIYRQLQVSVQLLYRGEKSASFCEREI